MKKPVSQDKRFKRFVVKGPKPVNKFIEIANAVLRLQQAVRELGPDAELTAIQLGGGVATAGLLRRETLLAWHDNMPTGLAMFSGGSRLNAVSKICGVAVDIPRGVYIHPRRGPVDPLEVTEFAPPLPSTLAKGKK